MLHLELSPFLPSNPIHFLSQCTVPNYIDAVEKFKTAIVIYFGIVIMYPPLQLVALVTNSTSKTYVWPDLARGKFTGKRTKTQQLCG